MTIPAIEIPENATCQEASILSFNRYIACGEKAVALIFHPKDNRSYWMCNHCAIHNINNRDGWLVAGAVQK